MPSSPRVMLVDDDAPILDVLTLAFEDAGYVTTTERDGLGAYRRLGSETFDAVLCDVNMPGMDGFTLVRKIRAEGRSVPVILLTSRDDEIDEALGLDLGADDYVAKPFSTRVLLARVGALVRRDALRRAPTPSVTTLGDGALVLCVERLEVTFHGAPCTLTLSEFRLLEALLRSRGRVCSRARLLEIVRGDDSVVVDRIIDTYVRRIRRKLESIDAGFDRIETVVGAGYRWKDR